MSSLFGSVRSGVEVEKWHGARNDFIFAEAGAFLRSLENGRDEASVAKVAVEICHRATGLGADGLVLWMKGSSGGVCAAIWNSDGSRAGTCGNALRCLAGLCLANMLWSGTGELPVYTLSIRGEQPVQENSVFARLLESSLEEPGGLCFRSKVEMGKVVKVQPISLSALNNAAFIGGTVAQEILLSVLHGVTFVELANPHLVLSLKPNSFRKFSTEHFVELGTLLQTETICQSLSIPLSNIGFVELPNEEQIQGGQPLNAIVFERGAGLTQCCGSGGCAMKAALENSKSSRPGQPESFSMPGGVITISVKNESLQLAGPAQRVCRMSLG
jgi:diaminopimelate epimerase